VKVPPAKPEMSKPWMGDAVRDDVDPVQAGVARPQASVALPLEGEIGLVDGDVLGVGSRAHQNLFSRDAAATAALIVV